MKNIVIISTYPESGSKNIGDQLITDSVKSSILHIANSKNVDVNIRTVFRADEWENIENIICDADFILFACLAIRYDMTIKEYPYIKKILEKDIPFGVISAGTSIRVHYKFENILEDFSKETVKILKTVGEKAKFFSTRGVLTQFICDEIGIDNSFFAGDIAFFSEGMSKTSFDRVKAINNIVVSSPHNPSIYNESLSTLISNLKSMFPDANITLAQHGENKFFKDFCKLKHINLVEIYKDKFKGLEIYDNADLHVGYRVHAHVSTLKRKKPSYLLEQDGRGADYGLTINVKCSVPSYIDNTEVSKNNVLNIADKVSRKIIGKTILSKKISPVPANLISAMIRNDMQLEFSKFKYLDDQINWFSENHIEYLSKIFE